MSRRLLRHLLLGAGAAATTGLLVWGFPGPLRARVSLATAYVALGLLGVTLSLGPLNVLRGRPNPVSFHLRRDFGIWSAVVGLVHTGFGLTVHFTGRMHLYFLAPPESRGFFGLRVDPFGGANWSGLAAALLLILLGAISNDASLRRLGTVRWRAIQRWAYGLAALTVMHAVLYQVLERQRVVLVVVFAMITMVVILLQLTGRRCFGAGR